MVGLFNLTGYLKRLMAHSVLSEAEQEAILGLPGQSVGVSSGDVFTFVGPEVTCAYVVASGLLARFNELADGQRRIAAFHIPGDMAAPFGSVRPGGMARMRALSASEIILISQDAFRALCEQHPPITEVLWRDSMLDSAILSQWLLNTRRDAKARIGHLLCEMAVRYNQPDGDYDFPVTQLQLADATGLTAVHVNRCLKLLRADGLVDFRQAKVRIFDWKRLVALTDFDPFYLARDVSDAPLPLKFHLRMDGAERMTIAG